MPNTSPTSVALSRRAFVATAAAGVAAACAPRRGAGPDGRLVLVGTYTNGERADGVYAFRADAVSGALTPLGAAAAGENPSYLAVDRSRRVVYAVNETTDYEGAASGAVAALALDPATGALTLLNRRASRGGAPCYITLDRAGRFALVANYVGGNAAVFPVGADGRLGDAAAVVQHAGRGARADRQEGPHAHCVMTDPTNRVALVADLGTDRVMAYRLDERLGTLTPAPSPYAALPPGAGPRHFDFHPTAPRVYLLNELDATLAAFRFDAASGALAPLQTLPLFDAPPAAGRPRSAADVHAHPSGRFVYASVRGDNVIAVLAVDPALGTMALVERVSTGGDWPRNFALDPPGAFLYAANQRSNTVVVFRVDPASGRLTPTGARVDVPAPACVRFV